MIKAGWKTYKFTDVTEIIGGGTPSKKVVEYWDGDIDWLTVADFNTGKKHVEKAEQKKNTTKQQSGLFKSPDYGSYYCVGSSLFFQKF